MRQDEIMPQASIASNLAQRIREEGGEREQWTDWLTECEWQHRSVNCGFPPVKIHAGSKNIDIEIKASGGSLRNAAANCENKASRNDDRCGNVAAARIDGRRNR
jgi:hypothetical protein